jgi:hypothetical protein
MATATVKYFSGTQEVKNIRAMRNAEFAAQFPGQTARRYDGFSMMVASVEGDSKNLIPVTRTIFYKKNPSLHKCDARCTSAKGKNCECSCGGQFHGSQA